MFNFEILTGKVLTVTITTSFDIRSYVNKQKAFWNEIAISYVFLGYIGGITLLLEADGWLNLLGTVLLMHSLIYSAYLSHEFMHGTIFKSRYWNVVFGQLMLWLNGGCYYGFQTLTLQHIAHHVDRVDVFTFDISAEIQKLPNLNRQIIVALEWLYFPVVSFWSRWQSIIKNWRNPEKQKQVTVIFAIRITGFAVLGIISFKALLLYFLSYMGMITVLRCLDAFQHTYEAFPVGTSLPGRDRNHEQTHTYSNLISRRYPQLNLLVLNFGYHNAHHAIMKCPWHSLPELDREFGQNQQVNIISFAEQLINYHRYRVTRLFAGQGKTTNEEGHQTYENFYGAVDVSFLTLY